MKKYLILIVVSILILIVWRFTPAIIAFVFNVCGYNVLGSFPDMFEVVNVLFSGLTVAFLLYTIWLSVDQKTQNAYQRYEDNFFKLIDLHLNHALELKDSFANFEKDNIAAINSIANSSWEEGYKTNFEQQHVVKNFVNYLLTFDFIVNTVLRKKTIETRKKYFKLYFAQLHINEKRFLLYHFNLGSTKPNGWNELKQYLFDGLSRDHLIDKLKQHKFDGIVDYVKPTEKQA